MTTGTNQPHSSNITSVVPHYTRGTGWSLADGVGGTKGVVSVIGCPVSLGQGKTGVQRGPDVIRNAGLIRRLERADWTVEDHGDVVIPPVVSTDPNVRSIPVWVGIGIGIGFGIGIGVQH